VGVPAGPCGAGFADANTCGKIEKVQPDEEANLKFRDCHLICATLL